MFSARFLPRCQHLGQSSNSVRIGVGGEHISLGTGTEAEAGMQLGAIVHKCKALGSVQGRRGDRGVGKRSSTAVPWRIMAGNHVWSMSMCVRLHEFMHTICAQVSMETRKGSQICTRPCLLGPSTSSQIMTQRVILNAQPSLG